MSERSCALTAINVLLWVGIAVLLITLVVD